MLVEGHKIICSKECATKKKCGDDDLRKAEEKIESLIRTQREKEAQLEITERQKDDLAKEPLEDIAKLKKDNRERNKFIYELRRTSMDFEDEVASSQNKKKVKEELGVDLNRYQNDIADLSAINKNMLISLETMTQEKKGYIENLKKYDYACLKQDHNNMKLVEKKAISRNN
ncbi:hypothetical protein JTB14_011516 [Gonioctena quinquepunctata]|nr:hypothetical protein JTB14_011516 [Gonioctena quinquepunctata]